MMEIKNVACGYAARTVVSGISFEVTSQDSLCILGPNGVGKTTFFKTIMGFLKMISGTILFNGEDISQWSRKRFAQKVGYVPQAHTPPFPFKVLDVVVMGRTAHLGIFAVPGSKDVAVAEEALATLGIAHLKDRVYTEISGGERQLVLIARALTQKPELLIMDEPTSNLDFGNQVKVLTHIKKLAEMGTMGVIMTTHVPNHAFYCATKVLLIGRNNTFLVGTPDEVITERNLKDIYDVDVQILTADREVSRGTLKACVPM